MVELNLEPLDGELAAGFYVSVRVGEVQKLSRISAGRAYKFPQSAVGDRKYGKIEIFKKVGACSVGIVPEAGVDQEVSVTLDDVKGVDNCKVKFKVSLTADTSGKPASSPVRASGSEDKPAMREVNPKVLQAKAYLEQHNLEMRLSEAMQAVLREKPDDPAAFVAEKLAKSAGSVLKKPQTESRPASPSKSLPPPTPSGAKAEQPAATPVTPSASKAVPELKGNGEEKEAVVAVKTRWDCRPSVGTWAAQRRGPKLITGARG